MFERFLLCQGTFYDTSDLLPVIGMDLIEVGFVRNSQLAGLKTVYAAHFVRPGHFIGDHIPMEAAHMGNSLRLPET